jgi:hypothetical protein
MNHRATSAERQESVRSQIERAWPKASDDWRESAAASLSGWAQALSVPVEPSKSAWGKLVEWAASRVAGPERAQTAEFGRKARSIRRRERRRTHVKNKAPSGWIEHGSVADWAEAALKTRESRGLEIAPAEAAVWFVAIARTMPVRWESLARLAKLPGFDWSLRVSAKELGLPGLQRVSPAQSALAAHEREGRWRLEGQGQLLGGQKALAAFLGLQMAIAERWAIAVEPALAARMRSTPTAAGLAVGASAGAKKAAEPRRAAPRL